MATVRPLHDPIALFQQKLSLAQQLPKEQMPEPTAFALATVGDDGQPSARMLLLKHADADGFVFYTNLESRKARELGANRKAAMCFHWAQLELQVRVAGRVSPVADAEADVYFATRPRGSQLGAWASRQSRPMDHAGDLVARVAAYEKQFASGPVPRPPFWSGFRLVPDEIEFWHGKPSRLHERQQFAHDGDGWRVTRLYP
jgi:pyridoxamine 5'-phosphate oxidase